MFALVKLKTDPDKKVDHEEDIEGEINLLRCAIFPFLTRLNSLSETKLKVSCSIIQVIIASAYSNQPH